MADIIQVSALNAYVRSLLESDPVLTDVAIRGEISNFNRHFKTGHCYFTLKDEKAGVKAVMFRSDAGRLSFLPENGMGVVVRGRISLYERDGAFQIYVDALFPDGVGAAQMAFEQLKRRLEQEGLFAPEHKKTLPRHPVLVGLVTSKTGAALQDILKVASRRSPTAKFLLAPVGVQGDNAAPGIAAAVQKLDENREVDVIIVARGGGSAEDLGVFNSETIARAVFACETPVVSAVGHEIDFTILDFVADVRAPTPSAAAELVLPDLYEDMRVMTNLYANIANFMHQTLDSCYNNLSACMHSAAFTHTRRLVSQNTQLLRQAQGMAQNVMHAKQQAKSAALQASLQLAGGLNPYAILARGYAVATAGGNTLRSVKDAMPQQAIRLRLQDGTLGCTVNDIEYAPPQAGEK